MIHVLVRLGIQMSSGMAGSRCSDDTVRDVSHPTFKTFPLVDSTPMSVLPRSNKDAACKLAFLQLSISNGELIFLRASNRIP